MVSIKGRVQPTGANTDQGPEEHSLDIDVFAGGVLLESVVKTMAKAGLSFTDFPAFNIECESSMSLRSFTPHGSHFEPLRSSSSPEPLRPHPPRIPSPVLPLPSIPSILSQIPFCNPWLLYSTS